MSTRCIVEIKDGAKKVCLYHHHDGYIEGVGYDLLKRFWLDEKGNFKELKNNYMLSCLENVVNHLIKDKNDEYELTTGTHTDIEYYYVIDIDKKDLKGYKAEYIYNEEEEKYYLHFLAEYNMQEIKEKADKQQAKYNKWQKMTKQVGFIYLDITDERWEHFKRISNCKPIIITRYNYQDYLLLLDADEYQAISCLIIDTIIVCKKDFMKGLY